MKSVLFIGAGWLVGYLHGYVVGEREGVDSDPDGTVEDKPVTVFHNNTITNDPSHGVHVTGWRNGG